MANSADDGEAVRTELRAYMSEQAAQRRSHPVYYNQQRSGEGMPIVGITVDTSQETQITSFMDLTILGVDPTSIPEFSGAEDAYAYFQGIPSRYSASFRTVIDESMLYASLPLAA